MFLRNIHGLWGLKCHLGVRRILLFGGLGTGVLLGLLRIIRGVRILWRIFREGRRIFCAERSRSCCGYGVFLCAKTGKTLFLLTWWAVLPFMPISWVRREVRPKVKCRPARSFHEQWGQGLQLSGDYYVARRLWTIGPIVLPEWEGSYILQIGVQRVKYVDEDGMKYGDDVEMLKWLLWIWLGWVSQKFECLIE